jgi:hypothetical protein
VEGGGQYDLEYRVRRRDGGHEWFKVRGRPIRNETGGIVRWFGTAVNVDDLKRAAVAMRQRDGHLEIDVSDDGAGFHLAAAAVGTPSGGLSSKFGLFSIKERMRALGGTFDIKSAPGKGTRATLVLPLRSDSGKVS